MMGKTWNINPPLASNLSGVIPGVAKRVGKMMIPAKIAMRESKKQTQPAEDTRLSLLGR
jgi:hypothetical protein